MAIERTFAMIKPVAVKDGLTGKVIDRIEQEGFTIVAMKKIKMTTEMAEQFYIVHNEKPFYREIVEANSAGPVVAMVLEKDGAIAAWRDVMGVTRPEEAAPGSIRQLYGLNVVDNVTHGSDAPETAETEIKLVFPELG